MDKLNKYFIYCTDKNPKFPSCDDQENWIIQMAESQELNIVGSFKDHNSNTQQFNLLLQAMNKYKAQGIFVWDISLIPNIPLVKKLIRTNKIHVIKPFLDT